MIIPVVLSGGAGTRLWPVSRKTHPKPFMKLADEMSFIQKTYRRALQIPEVQEVITITNKAYHLQSQLEYNTLKSPIPHHFLLEPCPKNTAPAIALCALKIYEVYGPDAILLVLPADHLIEDIHQFKEACRDAIFLANDQHIVTFGITPTSPETGYGYIECGAPYPLTNAYKIARFNEKPALEKARDYLASGKHLWNSGIFCFNANTILQELAIHAPELLAAAKKCWKLNSTPYHDPVVTFTAVQFDLLPNISLDYAVLEKTKASAVVASYFDWCDIGSWDAYSQLHVSDQNGNLALGKALFLDCQNTFIHNQEKLVASIGVDNLLVIDTKDALLITHRDRAQDVKQVAENLSTIKEHNDTSYGTALRPWGHYKVLEETPNCKIKKIIVKPGAALSLQSHEYRNEHWVVVEGKAKVIKDGKEFLLAPNESIYIPRKSLHRLLNPGASDLIIIEVQTGSYLGEDDIVRYADMYERECVALMDAE